MKTRDEVISLLSDMPENAVFDISITQGRPSDDYSLINCKFGSAEHMIRKSTIECKGDISLSYRYWVSDV